MVDYTDTMTPAASRSRALPTFAVSAGMPTSWQLIVPTGFHTGTTSHATSLATGIPTVGATDDRDAKQAGPPRDGPR